MQGEPKRSVKSAVAITKAAFATALIIVSLPSLGVTQDVQPPSVAAPGPSSDPAAPTPLIAAGQPAQWVAVFKFNTANFPSNSQDPGRVCPFGGSPTAYASGFSQRYIYASSANPQFVDGAGLVGTSSADPVGATFGEIYGGAYHYVVWNDQFYDAPQINGCSKECGSPWGHSKGIIAWDDAGNGVVLQVTTPSWPAAGSTSNPRQGDGDTLGCVSDDDVLVSQDFFALALTKDDLVKVLGALANASVVTDPSNVQIVNNGGPADVQQLVASLGRQSSSTAITNDVLSSGVELISKPSALHVPPWQMVSAVLGGVPLRVATWWTKPEIPSTDGSTTIGCWSQSLGTPGAVQIATSGTWEGQSIGLKGGLGSDFNHAKIGVSTDGSHSYSIFADMNQQGALSGNCGSSQNGRGGMFFVVNNPSLAASVSGLLTGDSGN